MSTRVAIIGSAGRGDRNSQMTIELYANMIKEAERIIQEEFKLESKDVFLVSGGSAWSDHVAVDLFLHKTYGGLILHLPSQIENGRFKNTPTLDRYHSDFSRVTHKKTMDEIEEAADSGAVTKVYPGFYARNTAIANGCDKLIAFSWGDTEPEPGGTLDTWRKTKCQKIYVNLGNLGNLGNL